MYKVVLVAVLTLLVVSAASAAAPGHKMGNMRQMIEVKKPRVPFKFGVGMKKFKTMCAQCHGEWGEGSDQGPPLMHDFYKPSHHGDPTFYNAALRGVKAHHWKFGDMPRVEGATAKDVERILPFIRWLQKENGLY